METLVALDAYASAGVGVLALFLGLFFTRKIPFLKRFCIPAPVSGGLLISLLTLLLYSVFGIECRFDGNSDWSYHRSGRTAGYRVQWDADCYCP